MEILVPSNLKNLTYQDHLKWYLVEPVTNKKTYFKTRENSSEFFGLELGSLTTNVMSWEEEFTIACELLVQNFGPTFNVFYSGGFDSEILVRTLVKIGAKPIVHTICFTSGENKNETDNSVSVCLELGLTQKLWFHNVQEYIQNKEYLELGVKYSCSQIAYLTVLKYIEKCTDYPCLLGGEIYCQKHAKPSFSAKPLDYSWYYIYRENEDAVTYRYSNATGHPVINEIFSYTPELMKAWFELNTIKDIVSGKIMHKLSLLSSKRLIFEEAYKTPTTAKRKLHGYENLMWTNRMANLEIRSHLLTPGTAKIEVCKLFN